MRIDVSVTPWSVAPLADPGPHGDARVPNMFAAGAAVVPPPPPVVAVVDEDEPRLLLHAPAAKAPTAATPSRRTMVLCRTMGSPLLIALVGGSDFPARKLAAWRGR